MNYISHDSHLQAETALGIFASYDLILDCTDTPASRYLISDACVLLRKPLVSASALRTDGQLMIFNYPPRQAGDPEGGPCYRCMFPRPPPAESVVSCGEGGILGPVVGVMGVLQALEAIKLITSPHGLSGAPLAQNEPQKALLFSAYGSIPFRSFKMCRRKKTCAACSSEASITRGSLNSGSLDYAHFCGAIDPVNALDPDERITASQFAGLRSDQNPQADAHESKQLTLIDTREPVQFKLCNLSNSINIPFSEIEAMRTGDKTAEVGESQGPAWLQDLYNQPQDAPIYVVCRLGNDSQLTVQKFKELGLGNHGQRTIRDIKGGLKAWRNEVDPEFPDY